MKKLYRRFVRIIYILVWPILSISMHNSRRVRVVVITNGQVLLQVTSAGKQKWSLPGGGIERKESPLQAAVREVKEETGVELQPKQLEFLVEKRASSYKKQLFKRFPKVTHLFFLAELSKKQSISISRPLEILEANWFKLNELPENCSETVKAGLQLFREQ